MKRQKKGADRSRSRGKMGAEKRKGRGETEKEAEELAKEQRQRTRKGNLAETPEAGVMAVCGTQLVRLNGRAERGKGKAQSQEGTRRSNGGKRRKKRRGRPTAGKGGVGHGQSK